MTDIERLEEVQRALFEQYIRNCQIAGWAYMIMAATTLILGAPLVYFLATA